MSSKLGAYQALGPSFTAVAHEYGLVRRQIAETQRMLANFDAMVAELKADDD